MQHELLHGHPTRWPLFNAALGIAPLAVWFPYAVYRESHLRHHDDTHLTDPDHDPESYYVSAAQWRDAGPAMRALLGFRNTFVGRMMIGPAFAIGGALAGGVREIAGGNLRAAGAWALHLVMLGALAAWLEVRCGIDPFVFAMGIGYPALALSSVRSFREHRAAHEISERTVINESAWFWRLLFLNNNYHAVHHDLPCVPWFAIGRVYHERRAAYRARNGGFVAQGYGEWLTRHAMTPVAPPLHPAHAVHGINGVDSIVAPERVAALGTSA